jgi:hypothetical protein
MFVVTGSSPLPKCLIQADSASNGNVQALHHADHRNLDCRVSHGSSLIGDTSHFVAKHQRNWLPEIPMIERTRSGSDARDENGETSFPQLVVAVANRIVSLDFHPFCGACRGLPCERCWRRLFNAVDRVCSQHTSRIARAENGTDVMRVVHVFQHDRQIRLASRQHRPDSCLPSFGSWPPLRLLRLGSG